MGWGDGWMCAQLNGGWKDGWSEVGSNGWIDIG